MSVALVSELHRPPQMLPVLSITVFLKRVRAPCVPLCPAAVLWCSGSHIYGVSEGQWGLLPGSALCLCRRVNCRTRLQQSEALEPLEGPGRNLAGPGSLPVPARIGLDGVTPPAAHCPRRLRLAPIKVEPALFFLPFLLFYSD